MKRLKDEISQFMHCKTYVIAVSLIALCSYGFTVTHPAIGMDDTVIPLYFEEGVAPFVGRWCFFVINKILHINIGDFAPWMTELLSVLILIMSVTLWCIFWKRICEPKIKLPIWSYLFPAGLFLSCPLISEVFVFYLHNGICMAYGTTALALLCLLESLSAGNNRHQHILYTFYSSVLLTVSLGFYESFSIVYIMGGVMAFFLLRKIYGKTGQETLYETRIFPWMRNGFLIMISSLLLRAVILAVLNAAYHLERLNIYNVKYRHLFGDIFSTEGELIMNLKRFWVLYYVNGVVYFPITILVLSFIAIGIYSLYQGIRKRDIMLPVCSIAMVLLPILMSIVEGLPTRYRSSQYVPLIGAFAVLLLMIEFQLHKTPKWIPAVSYFLLFVLIYDQCADMNKWFYMDYLKYQDAVNVMNQVAYDLESGFDTTKPIVFRGAYHVPYSITKSAYCSFSSPQYRWISLLTDPIDPYLKEKYYAANGQGYTFAEMPLVSVLQWGLTSFNGTAWQLIQFLEMHGHSFRCETDLAIIEEAEQIRQNMPGYPTEGYIMELDNYIIVNLESY